MEAKLKVCRTCLGARTKAKTENAHLTCLFTPPPPGRPNLTDMLVQIAQVQVIENDGLPSDICFQCIKSTYNAFAFKQLCEESDAKLRNYFSVDRLNAISVADIKLESCDENRQSNEDFQRISTFYADISKKSSRASNFSKNSKSCAVSFGEKKNTDGLICALELQPFNIKDECFQSRNLVNASNNSLFTREMQEKSKSINHKNDPLSKLENYLNFEHSSSESCGIKDITDDNCTSMTKEEIFLSPIANKKEQKPLIKEHIVVSENQLDLNGKKDNTDLIDTNFCILCEKQFDTNKELKKHLKTNHKKKNPQITCKICNQNFAYKQTLTRHMKIHENNTKNKLCTVCGKSFLRADDLKRHTRIHTGERPYSCDQCPKKYKQSSELKDHMKSHSLAKSYMCTECGKSLASRNGLYIHMKVHKGEKNRECKICGNKYVTNGELNSHINHIHSKEKPFKCLYEGCSRAFTTKLSLNTHLRAHTGEKPFKCTTCNKSLATLSSLHEHKRIHTGEKPKKCNICEQRLGNAQALKKHIRLHTGERPYQCSICFERFICASTLNTHIKIKHMEKQHRCTICHKMFALSAKLRQHIRLHAEKKFYTCNFCNLTFNQKQKLHQHNKVHEDNKAMNEPCIEESKQQMVTDIISLSHLSMPSMLQSQYI